ncbi:MAG: hypothetical protein KC561_02685 [Myxococcales bacterium]|nr:hypothetical protein [Myxococcales bacterium]
MRKVAPELTENMLLRLLVRGSHRSFGGVLVVCLAALSAHPQSVHALEPNLRQAEEGYWVGSNPEPHHIEELYERGVRVIASGVSLSPEAYGTLTRLGMERVDVRFGARFRIGDDLLSGTEGFEPEQIFLHCDHGGDRAGAMLAFLLVVREGWRPDHAILAVAYPGENDVRRIVAAMEARGLYISDEELETYTGIYSGASNGGSGGLKLRGEGYRQLVDTLLDTFESYGVELHEEAPLDDLPGEQSAEDHPEEAPADPADGGESQVVGEDTAIQPGGEGVEGDVPRSPDDAPQG